VITSLAVGVGLGLLRERLVGWNIRCSIAFWVGDFWLRILSPPPITLGNHQNAIHYRVPHAFGVICVLPDSSAV
jgi:hypothetical protein